MPARQSAGRHLSSRRARGHRGASPSGHDLLILSDEAYDHIVYGDAEFTSALQIDSMHDRLIYCQTFSKTFAMTGWRIGYIAAPPDIAPAAGLMHRTFSGPVNSAVQRSALAAVTQQLDLARRAAG